MTLLNGVKKSKKEKQDLMGDCEDTSTMEPAY
jgi:hypothetical protein